MLDFCFGDLGLHHAQAFIHPDNTTSIALVEKLGFRRGGRLRESLRVGNLWRDELLYARLTTDRSGPMLRPHRAGRRRRWPAGQPVHVSGCLRRENDISECDGHGGYGIPRGRLRRRTACIAVNRARSLLHGERNIPHRPFPVGAHRHPMQHVMPRRRHGAAGEQHIHRAVDQWMQRLHHLAAPRDFQP
jgi:hypothetical protein